MIKMEFAGFIFKFSNNVLPNSLNSYFINVENIHTLQYETKKVKMSIFRFLSALKPGKNVALSWFEHSHLVTIRGGVLEDVLGLEDVLEDTF